MEHAPKSDFGTVIPLPKTFSCGRRYSCGRSILVILYMNPKTYPMWCSSMIREFPKTWLCSIFAYSLSDRLWSDVGEGVADDVWGLSWWFWSRHCSDWVSESERYFLFGVVWWRFLWPYALECYCCFITFLVLNWIWIMSWTDVRNHYLIFSSSGCNKHFIII